MLKERNLSSSGLKGPALAVRRPSAHKCLSACLVLVALLRLVEPKALRIRGRLASLRDTRVKKGQLSSRRTEQGVEILRGKLIPGGPLALKPCSF